MNTLTAICYDCDAEVVVFGYYLAPDELELVEPPHYDDPDHHTHDVSVTGYA